MFSATPTDRHLPAVTGKPGIFKCRFSKRRTSWRKAEALEMVFNTAGIGPDVCMAVFNGNSLCIIRYDMLTTPAAKFLPFSGLFLLQVPFFNNIRVTQAVKKISNNGIHIN